MPSLRLTDDEARAITAYLRDARLAAAGRRRRSAQRLADPANVAGGREARAQVRLRRLPRHPRHGERVAHRRRARRRSASKTQEELFFGDRTDLPRDWDDWTFHKLKEPRGYETKWIEQLMPQFDLADEDIKALRVFLAEPHRGQGARAATATSARRQTDIVDGRRLVARYNCTGCHVIEERGGNIRRLYEKQPTLAPPNLHGEGKKVQSPWLFSFLKAPTPIRPWLKVRMPTFGLSDDETTTAVLRYFAALDRKDGAVRASRPRDARSPPIVEAGELLTSPDYFALLLCHLRGDAEAARASRTAGRPTSRMAAQRLYPEWIVEWIHDPQKLMPGTKMPSFYTIRTIRTDRPDVLERRRRAQMRALRDYVISLGLARAAPRADRGRHRRARPRLRDATNSTHPDAQGGQ